MTGATPGGGGKCGSGTVLGTGMPVFTYHVPSSSAVAKLAALLCPSHAPNKRDKTAMDIIRPAALIVPRSFYLP